MKSLKRSVYLDNAATTFPKPDDVYTKVELMMREVGGSAGRSGHRGALEAGREVYAARESLANLFGVRDPLRVIFTKNATEAINTAIWGLLKPGDHVVTTSVEHNSVMRPLTAATKLGIEHTVVPCETDGSLEASRVAGAIRSETALIIVNHASNVAGTILPVADVATIAHARKIPVLVDAAQSAGRVKIDIEADGIDILAFTGHKELFGPQGTGGMCVSEEIELTPMCFGGTGSKSSSLEQPRDLPDRLESGTLNAPGFAGLGAGAEFILRTGIDSIRAHEHELIGRLVQGLEMAEGVTWYGPQVPEQRVGIVSMTFDSMTPADVAELLDLHYDIATRSGLHCSPMAHKTIGTIDTGTLRVSTSFMSTTDEIDYFLDSLTEILKP
ncbi:MAG TPA: aminotransferase class V-fold PLP-dependent enzyme [Candidatus Anoxymicrobiaceae bacterium]